MSTVSEQTILSELKKMPAPDNNAADIVDSGIVQSVDIEDDTVICVLTVDPDKGTALEDFRQDVERRIRDMDGVGKATVVLTAEKKAPEIKTQSARHEQQKQAEQRQLVPDVKNIIAVASGKGGVGKSTISINLAACLVKMGYKAGLLDADIYGPSVPKLTGLAGQKPQGGKHESGEYQHIEPLSAHGLKVMSIGFMIADEAPMIWRGPMVQSALVQLMRDVNWGDQDYLIVDMPPGTGDAQLTMAQKVPLSGAVIVSTPQDLALADARKGIAMFEKVGVPILGLIENMSYFQCPHCGERSEIFGYGGAREESEAQNIPFLGEIDRKSVV